MNMWTYYGSVSFIKQNFNGIEDTDLSTLQVSTSVLTSALTKPEIFGHPNWKIGSGAGTAITYRIVPQWAPDGDSRSQRECGIWYTLGCAYSQKDHTAPQDVCYYQITGNTRNAAANVISTPTMAPFTALDIALRLKRYTTLHYYVLTSSLIPDQTELKN